MSIFGSTLGDMIGAVKDAKPNAPVPAISRAINSKIKLVTARRAWSDLIAQVTQNYVQPENTGLITTTTGANVIIGTGPDGSGNYATWPVGDYINTTAAGQFPNVRQAGYQRVSPASMAMIKPGQWLYVDSPTPYAEPVCIVWTDAISFIAKFIYPHNMNFPIQASSFAGLQIQPAYPLATITAVVDETTMLVDQTWGGPSLTAVPYNVLTAYITPDPYCSRIIFANDPVAGQPIDVDNTTYQQLIISDPQLTTSQQPTIIAPCPFLNGGGLAQFLTYPLVFQPYYLNLVIAKTWPKLIQDSDRSPFFLDSEMFVAGARATVLRQKVLLERQREDPYYDPDLAMTYERQFEQYYEAAEDRDESISHHKLQSYGVTVVGGYSPSYWISHCPWPTDVSDAYSW